MRGLSARCAYAMYRVLAPLRQPGELDELLAEAEYLAQAQGMSDYDEGLRTPPAMFADEPRLLGQWQWGMKTSADAEEMASCAGCRNPAYDWHGVCAVHG